MKLPALVLAALAAPLAAAEPPPAPSTRELERINWMELREWVPSRSKTVQVADTIRRSNEAGL